MKLRVAVVGLAACLSACGESHETVAGPRQCPADTPVAVANIAAPQDFSALDPARCPPILPEQLHGARPTAPLVQPASTIEGKNFYVLALLDSVADARAAVTAWPALAALAAEHLGALRSGSSCLDKPACFGELFKLRWSGTDIDRAGDALVALHGTSGAIQAAAAGLRRSGEAQLHASLSDAELLRAAWQDAAHALNQGWDEHVAGLPLETVERLVADIATKSTGRPFFWPSLQVVLGGLEADGRDEAARYEPLADEENAAALGRIPCIDFSRYAFTAIVVPGLGPTDLTHALDPGGQIRADQAAARLAAGLAPLIVLSGGHVHPDRTPYSEAIEMKKYLMATYAIPETALLVDPHARHTTTNLRNVARLLYRYGIPVDRPSLITTDQFQTAYIAAAGATQVFGKRCLDELGYFPYRGMTQLDRLDDCWVPSVDSLYADARDLLDP
jgi:hypothetical protein